MLSSQIEIWVSPIFCRGLYEVSSLGRVKSNKVQKQKILSQKRNWSGYPRVALFLSGKRYEHAVHRLVASMFCDNPLNKPEVNHIDGIRNNNFSSNLEWVTEKENTQHSQRVLGNNVAGENNPNAKLSEKEKADIIELWRSREFSQKDLAKKFNVSISCIKAYAKKEMLNE